MDDLDRLVGKQFALAEQKGRRQEGQGDDDGTSRRPQQPASQRQQSAKARGKGPHKRETKEIINKASTESQTTTKFAVANKVDDSPKKNRRRGRGGRGNSKGNHADEKLKNTVVSFVKAEKSASHRAEANEPQKADSPKRGRRRESGSGKGATYSRSSSNDADEEESKETKETTNKDQESKTLSGEARETQKVRKGNSKSNITGRNESEKDVGTADRTSRDSATKIVDSPRKGHHHGGRDQGGRHSRSSNAADEESNNIIGAIDEERDMGEGGGKGGRRGRRPRRKGPRGGGDTKATEAHQNKSPSENHILESEEPKQGPSGTAKSMKKKKKSKKKETPFPSYWSLEDCMALYASKDPLLVRGMIRMLPTRDGKAFVTCDRGNYFRDVLVETPLDQNRALDGDTVFVELYPEEEEKATSVAQLTQSVKQLMIYETDESTIQDESPHPTWQDDVVQRKLWNPTVPVRKVPDAHRQPIPEEAQRKGRVIYVVPPKDSASTQPSELRPSDESYRSRAPRRTIVGTMNKMSREKGDLYLLTPNKKTLPQFLCPKNFRESQVEGDGNAVLYKAEYEYGTWLESHRWPSCDNVSPMGKICNVEDETLALLVENDVNHGDFPAQVLKDVDVAVESGLFRDGSSQGWRPTREMYRGRRDYRKERIFTIDPTTAKDLDDALHVKKLPDGRVEIGVHIADVSFFVQPSTSVDEEAARRATTVYLVDRTIPMLPRPLCEVACSLNENVERLAFSCVWKMNLDGTVEGSGQTKSDDVWYGRTVIKSCARLDYATAQNIIENKVATGERPEDMDNELWPQSRRPKNEHTVDEVASDVRLMHRVAMARRRLRFESGAIALNGIKLAFQLDSDGETPLLCAPYPIRDSNRLVEEYMLLANYLVAQRLIEKCHGLALLRQHPPPLMLGVENVVKVAKEGMGFDIDATSSQTLQESLSSLGRACHDDLVLQCVTEMLTTPMRPAEYVAAGEISEEEWRHFALNIPYYTHFTSPIRRYADVIVHRLLQATIDGEEAVRTFPMGQGEIQKKAIHCNEKRMGSKRAQERSDRVFLALYLRKHPLKSQLGVILSVGEKTFSVFVPSLGISVMLFLDEHRDILSFTPTTNGDERRIRLTRKQSNSAPTWNNIEIRFFAKISVSCHCKEKPPIDVRVRLEGPWTESE